jgi:spore coat protein JB
MDEARENLLHQVMASGFAAGDLHLYLNTHPCDCRAVMIYMILVKRASFVRNCYESMYGPLTASASSTFPWPWIESPWPWEDR